MASATATLMTWPCQHIGGDHNTNMHMVGSATAIWRSMAMPACAPVDTVDAHMASAMVTVTTPPCQHIKGNGDATHT